MRKAADFDERKHLTYCFLSSALFPNGKQRDQLVSKDPVLYHANWEVGLESKIERLRYHIFCYTDTSSVFFLTE